MKVAFERDGRTDTQTDRRTDGRTNKHQILGTLYTKGPKGQKTLVEKIMQIHKRDVDGDPLTVSTTFN